MVGERYCRKPSVVRRRRRAPAANITNGSAVSGPVNIRSALRVSDGAGVAKRALVAHRGGTRGGLALSGHMDTVPETGWQENPWSARLDRDGDTAPFGAASRAVTSDWRTAYDSPSGFIRRAWSGWHSTSCAATRAGS